jgi:SAM-dependent methyltransferase
VVVALLDDHAAILGSNTHDVSLGDRLAPLLMDALGGSFEKKPFTIEKRTQLMSSAEGSVLEVGGGTGFNLRYYPAAVSAITVTDPVDGMLKRARKRAAEAGKEITTTRASAEALPFEDGSFDTVVASWVLCSVDDQDRALAEIRRVLRPGGGYLFMEHVRADDPDLSRKQDRWERLWMCACFGCHPNRDTLPRIESAFDVEEVERGRAPQGPKLVRPYVLGRAVKQGRASA